MPNRCAIPQWSWPKPLSTAALRRFLREHAGRDWYEMCVPWFSDEPPKVYYSIRRTGE